MVMRVMAMHPQKIMFFDIENMIRLLLKTSSAFGRLRSIFLLEIVFALSSIFVIIKKRSVKSTKSRCVCYSYR